MIRLIALGGVIYLLAVAAPAVADHDNGNGKSQDHLHRNNGNGVVRLATVEPVLGGILAGVGLVGAALLRRRR